MSFSSPPLRFAFVAHTKRADKIMNDPSFIYRCENLALALRQAGHHVELVHYTQFESRSQYDAVVFHRPKYRFGFARLIKKLQQRGIKVIADFDDLVFDPAKASVSPGVINKQVSIEQTRKNFKANQKALACFDAMTVSTEPLLQEAKRAGIENTHFLPNSVHFSWFNADHPDKPQQARLTYFPGTRSHDKDFAIIQEPLQDYLNDHPDVQLQITGPLSQSVQCRNNQLIRFDKQPFNLYHTHVATSWLNLAPLEDTPFNAHKSALKTIESGFYNAATLASPIPDMQRLENQGSILVPWQGGDWYQAINNNLHQPPSGLRQRLLQENHIEQLAANWLTWLGLPPPNKERM